MQHRVTAFLAGLFLALSSHLTIAAESTVKDVNRALASSEPVVLIGVPADFLHPETIEDDSVEAVSDWAYYLNDWIKNSEKKLKAVIVQHDILARALQTPVFRKKKSCATLFVKNRTEGLLHYDNNCVLFQETYGVGAKWLEGAASVSELEQHGFKNTAVIARGQK